MYIKIFLQAQNGRSNKISFKLILVIDPFICLCEFGKRQFGFKIVGDDFFFYLL